MDLRIKDISEFINCIHDYITEEYNILPRDFETNLVIGQKSLIWYRNTGRIEQFDCLHFNRHLHVHDEISNSKRPNVVCCNEVDIIALKYLEGSIFGNFKSDIISSLHTWLPAATFQTVQVKMLPTITTTTTMTLQNDTMLFNNLFRNICNENDEDSQHRRQKRQQRRQREIELDGIVKEYDPSDRRSLEIKSYFEPSYLFHYLYSGEKCAANYLSQIYYVYYLDSNIVRPFYQQNYTFVVQHSVEQEDEEKVEECINRAIMVRARSRSRSRSRSASPVAKKSRRSGKKRSSRRGRSRSRSASPTRAASPVRRVSGRRRSRSRSRSRSRR